MFRTYKQEVTVRCCEVSGFKCQWLTPKMTPAGGNNDCPGEVSGSRKSPTRGNSDCCMGKKKKVGEKRWAPQVCVFSLSIFSSPCGTSAKSLAQSNCDHNASANRSSKSDPLAQGNVLLGSRLNGCNPSMASYRSCQKHNKSHDFQTSQNSRNLFWRITLMLGYF